jgi:hypothetical protein
LNKITVGDYGGEQFYMHADLGGPLLDGKLGYRLNLLGQNGATDIDGQKLERWLVSGAVDWNVTDDLLLQFNASYGKYDLTGRQAQFNLADTSLGSIPKALDSTKLWGPDIRQIAMGLFWLAVRGDSARGSACAVSGRTA